ncbi:MAG: DUF2442 domain-containing protein [Phycisphaerae bacterium]|jgi:hypothetical protein|nr:DUF2442 domain-containing protein [Phycisphaerae bacterium]
MPTTKPITAERIEATEQELIIGVAAGDVRIRWEDCSPKLASATPQQRAEAELSPGGYGIHWSTIDEDLAVGALISAIRT